MRGLVSEVSSIAYHRVRRYDINVHVEDIKARWLRGARINVWIPNQEWIRPHSKSAMHDVDVALCKTHAGEEVLLNQGIRSEFVGFSSSDRFDGSVEREERALHVAGLSPNKGTHVVIEAWRSHPEWPVLDLIWSPPRNAELRLPRNVQLHTSPISDEQIRRLQNRAAFHICPSSVEGFGHTLVEAMSCGACVVTTDAPPMHELVQVERGILVPWARSESVGLATAYHIDPDALSQSFEVALNLPLSERMAMGQLARTWYQSNDRAFQERFRNTLVKISS